MAREIWSTDFVTDSRTGTDGPLWWGESAQEGCQRTLSRTRGRERTVRCGGESPRRRAVNGPLRVTDSRTGTDGPLWVGRVHAGGRMVNGAGDLVNRLCHGLADENGRSALGGRESMREGG